MCKELNHENGCRRFHHGPMATETINELPNSVAELESVGCLINDDGEIIPIVEKHGGAYTVPTTKNGWAYQGVNHFDASEEFIEALSAPDREVFDKILARNLNARDPLEDPRKFRNY